jgi:hypothetical protein
MIAINDHCGENVNDSPVLFRYRQAGWSGAHRPLRRMHSSQRPRPSAHATAEKQQQPGASFGQQHVAKDRAA